MEFSPAELETIIAALKWVGRDYHNIAVNSPEGRDLQGKKFKDLEKEAWELLAKLKPNADPRV